MSDSRPSEEGHLLIWDEVRTPQVTNTKEFQASWGGKARTVSPTYNYQRATALFGPYGIGWRVLIEDSTVEEVDNNKIHTLVIYLRYEWNGQQGSALGVGCTAISSTTSTGKRKVDDDYFKKSLTDAIGNALQKLGFNADIGMGLFDDVKYVNQLRKQQQGDDA